MDGLKLLLEESSIASRKAFITAGSMIIMCLMPLSLPPTLLLFHVPLTTLAACMSVNVLNRVECMQSYRQCILPVVEWVWWIPYFLMAIMIFYSHAKIYLPLLLVTQS
jgi:hypothetical protein